MREFLIDLLYILGLASIGYGVYQFSPPIMYIVEGCLMLFFALKATQKDEKMPENGENE